MKIPNDYMAMSYRMEIVEDKDEGGFVVSYLDLPGCITCGGTVESVVANALGAKKAWFEAYFQNSDCETHMLWLNEMATNWQQKISEPK